MADPLNLAELVRLYEQATEGAWRCDSDPIGGEWIGTPLADIAQLNDDWPIDELRELRANAALIVALHNAFPAIRERLEAEEWRPIETAPRGDNPEEENGSPIIGWRPGWPHGYEIYWYARDQAWYFANLDSEYGGEEYPTHWRPLPSPPATEKEG